MGYFCSAIMHAYTMSLHDGCLSIDINYKSWQVVTLSMNQTVGVVIRSSGKANSQTDIISCS